MADSAPGSNAEDPNSSQPYLAFILVPVFFLLGLLGVLICHILKKRGYRCTTDSEEDEDLDKEENEEKGDPEKGDLNETFSEGNTDTVGHIVRCIMKNEANTDALQAMVLENIDSDGAPITPTTPNTPNTPETPGLPGLPPTAAKHTCNHLHTIGGAAGSKNICHRCNQKKWPLMRRSSSRKLERRSHAGEVTVLSVGRFRVTKCDPKLARDRKTLLITEPNGAPSSPSKAETPDSATSLRLQVKEERID